MAVSPARFCPRYFCGTRNILNLNTKAMDTILVATDFSPAAANAACYAADMAGMAGKKLLLLHIYTLPLTWAQIAITTDFTNMTEDAQTEMNRLKEQLLQRDTTPLEIDTVIKTGTFYQELKAVCDRIKPYVVIMGSQGTSATERFFFGGHTVHAMQHLQWPLITVPLGTGFSYIRRIALACDFEGVANVTPVETIKNLVKDFNASLHILNVGKESELAPDVVFESGVLRELLDELAPQYHFIAHDDTSKALADFVKTYHIHLLLVLPRQHQLTERLLQKSHTRELVLHSSVPVMALHKQE